jgi:serine/threonine protein kinase
MPAPSGKTDGSPERGPAGRADSTSQLPPIAASARMFGKYRLLAELGRGGMADVHLAVAIGPAGFSKLQVIKRLRPGMTDIEEMRSMMLDEARLAARLNHKNIVQTNEVGVVDEQYFLAMEYLDGQPYHRILKRAAQLGRAIGLPFAVKILCEILSGLHYAHEVKDYDGHPLGVIHRDVSPQNVFVTYDGQVKVVDFGIAKAARRLVETQTGIIRGKITYMAPEQAFASEIDRRADIFSVGVMLWEAVAGERLWGNLSDPEIVARLMHEIPRVTTVRPDAPAALADLCARALARDPERRPATAAEMRAGLEEYLATHDVQVNAEALGALVADLFAEERAELQALVDGELAVLRVEGEAAEGVDTSGARTRDNIIPPAPVPRTPGIRNSRIPASPAVPSPRDSGPPRASGEVARRKSGGWGPPPEVAPVPDSPAPPDSMSGPTIPRAPAFDLDDGGSTARELSPPVTVLSTAPPPEGSPSSVTHPSATPSWAADSPRKWRHPVLYGAAVLVAAAAAALVGKAGLSGDAAPAQGSVPVPSTPSAKAAATSAPVATALPPPASAIAAPPDDRYIMLRIRTNPGEARILFDGTPMSPGKSPFELKLPKDGAVHRITVEAAGFHPQSRMVVFDRDQKIEVFLHSKKAGPPPRDSQNR